MAVPELQLNTTVTLRVRFTEDGTPINIGTSSGRQIRLRRGSGTVVVKTASFTTSSGTDGILTYNTTSTDLGVSGTWKIQGRATSTAFDYYTAVGEFKVLGNLST